MAKQNSSKASATVQRLRVSLLFNPSTTWLREAIKKTYETLDIVHSSDDTPEHERQHCSSGNDIFKHNETNTVG